MTFAQLKHFTYEELRCFTYDELNLDINDLISVIQDENKAVPYRTLSTLLSLAGKCGISAPEFVKSGWTVEQKLKLLSIIVGIIMKLLCNSEGEPNIIYNNYGDINVSIQSSIGKADYSLLNDICNQIQDELQNNK